MPCGDIGKGSGPGKSMFPGSDNMVLVEVCRAYSGHGIAEVIDIDNLLKVARPAAKAISRHLDELTGRRFAISQLRCDRRKQVPAVKTVGQPGRFQAQ